MTRRRHFLSLFLLASSLAGCEFARRYDALAHQPVNPAQPLIGAYSGTWHDSGNLNERFLINFRGGAARVAISTQSDSDQLLLSLALDGHSGVSTSEIVGTLSLDSGSLTSFHAKLPMGPYLVMDVTGQLADAELTIHYTIVDLGDAEVQHEHGTLHVRRV